MHNVSLSREMDVSSDKVWQILDDFGGVYRFHPLVERSPLKPGKPTGIGAQRMCEFSDGNCIHEEIVEYEPGKAIGIEITDAGSFPLKWSVGRISVEALSSRRTRVKFELGFVAKFGPIGWLMGKAIMEGQFRKILTRVLEGLETHAKTGAVVGAAA